jgi:integrase
LPRLSLRSHLESLKKLGKISAKMIGNYASAIKRLDVDVVDTDDLQAFWTYLASRLPQYDANDTLVKGIPYSYIMHANALASSMLKWHGIESKGPGYGAFGARLGKLESKGVGAYTEKEIKLILDATKGMGFGLYRLVIFLVYTGAKISSAEGARISDFREVPGFDRVRAVPLIGKNGHPYVGIISKKAAKRIYDYDPHLTDSVSGYDERRKSNFSTYNRAQLAYRISQAGLFDKVTQNRNIMNSFRKFFAARLFEDGLASKDIELLMGHMPSGLAYKADAAGTKKITERAAAAYSKSSLVEWEAWG